MSQKPIQYNVAPTDPVNIKAEDDASWITGILGSSASSVSCILPFGNRLAISKISDNLVRLSSGIFSMQGFGIKVPDSESFTIQSGAQGQNRIDLIVAEYIKGSPRDSYQLKVVQGTQTTGTPAPPSLTTQDLHFGGSTRQEEIARVILSGTSITSVQLTATVIKGLTEILQLVNGLAGTGRTSETVKGNADNITKVVSGTTKAGDASKLGGLAPSAFATAAQGTLADDAMPKSGGIFTGGINANGLNIPTGKQGAQADAPLYTNSLVNKEYADKLNYNINASDISSKTMTRLVGLIKHADCPNSSEYWYILTFNHFNNKVQIALPYSRMEAGKMEFYVRTLYDYPGYGWSPWNLFGANPKTLFGSSVPSSLLPSQIFIKI